MIFPTQFGDMTVLEPSAERVDALGALLPMGLVRLPPNPENVRYGIVMQCGDKEVYGVKQQIIDLPGGLAQQEMNLLDFLICMAVFPYLQHKFSGVLMPLKYSKPKGAQHEIGIAYFGAPHPRGREATDWEGDVVWDSRFGVGFSAMFAAFMNAVSESQKGISRSLHPMVGLDYQPRLAIGCLHLGFAIHDGDIFMLNRNVALCERPFTLFRSGGIDRVYHLPSVTFISPAADAGLVEPEKSPSGDAD